MDKVKKIREEVKKLHGNPYYMMAVKDVLAIIDPLQEEAVSEVLEDATRVYCVDARKGYPRVMDETDRYICNAFKAGAQWQEKQDKETIELAEDHAMLAGMEKMKEEIMAKAVEGVVAFDYYGDDDKTYGLIAHDSFCLEDFGLKDMDKVKMILIKED